VILPLTYQARTFEQLRRPPGYTFMELLVVLVLLAAVMFIGVPSFQALLGSQLDKEVNRLGGLLRLLRNEAVLERTAFRLTFELDKASYFVEERLSDGSYAARSDHDLMRAHEFPEAVYVERMLMFEKEILPERKEPVYVLIDSSGFVDPFLLHIFAGEEPFTFKVSGFTGKVSLQEGHVDE